MCAFEVNYQQVLSKSSGEVYTVTGTFKHLTLTVVDTDKLKLYRLHFDSPYAVLKPEQSPAQVCRLTSVETKLGLQSLYRVVSRPETSPKIVNLIMKLRSFVVVLEIHLVPVPSMDTVIQGVLECLQHG